MRFFSSGMTADRKVARIMQPLGKGDSRANVLRHHPGAGGPCTDPEV
jgi:hypothetical protein